ncbi:HET-domain-containing protein, partial [Zopfia rhizophila CBS 207.26]
MRLINTQAMPLEEYFGDAIPEYAILSHTWEDGEITLAEFAMPEAKAKPGYEKIEYTCKQAVEDGLKYAWVDTCCIDKSSSAELLEAINSMFEWYRYAAVCYAYLIDVTKEDFDEAFAQSRWFPRGWTLQELIAPHDVIFYGHKWDQLGRKKDLIDSISSITGIAAESLLSIHSVFRESIACRMSWAAHRRTMRIEDEAYSLLGIFGVHMPLLYGEGNHAFIRLQEEIMKVSDDQTILA